MFQFFKKIKEDKYKLLYDTSRDAIMTMESPDWKFTAGNPAAVKMFNCKDEKEFNSLGPWDVSPKIQPDGQLSTVKAQRMIMQAVKEGSVFFEWTHKKYKGEDFPATVLLSGFKQNGKDAVQASVRDITAIKKAEEEFKKSEKKFRILVEMIPDWIWEVDSKGIYTYVSPKIKDILGYKPEEIIGKTPFDLMLKDEVEQKSEQFLGIIKNKKPFYGLENWNLKKNGGKVLLESSGVPILDKEGNLLGYRGIDRDITERKEMQGKIVQFTDTAKKNLDVLIPLLQKVARGDFSESITIPEKEDEFTELLVALKLTVDDLRGDKEEIDKRERKLKDAKVAAQNILHDLRLEKEALADAKAKDEALLQSIGEGVVAVDQNGKIILINPSAKQMLGLSYEQAMGKLIFDAWRVIDEKRNLVPEEKRPITIALKGKTTVTTTGPSYFFTKKNGAVFPVAIIVTPVIVKNKIIGAIESFRDITHEREVDRAKTEFVSLASHQLRTPLTGINWLTEMLCKGDLGKISSKQKEIIEVVHHSAKQMTELIGALLNVSRLELGIFSINPKTVKLNKIINEIVQELSPTIIKKGIKIKKDYSDTILSINADPILLKIVCQNLLSNAVNYALPKTAVTAKIGKDNNNLLFTVTNQGIGISKEEQSKIFTKLFRASNAQLFVTEGTGLGLYIAKLIIDATDGKIWFDSELNQETNFYVSLPLKRMGVKKEGKPLESGGKILEGAILNFQNINNKL